MGDLLDGDVDGVLVSEIHRGEEVPLPGVWLVESVVVAHRCCGDGEIIEKGVAPGHGHECKRARDDVRKE